MRDAAGDERNQGLAHAEAWAAAKAAVLSDPISRDPTHPDYQQEKARARARVQAKIRKAGAQAKANKPKPKALPQALKQKRYSSNESYRATKAAVRKALITLEHN